MINLLLVSILSMQKKMEIKNLNEYQQNQPNCKSQLKVYHFVVSPWNTILINTLSLDEEEKEENLSQKMLNFRFWNTAKSQWKFSRKSKSGSAMKKNNFMWDKEEDDIVKLLDAQKASDISHIIYDVKRTKMMTHEVRMKRKKRWKIKLRTRKNFIILNDGKKFYYTHKNNQPLMNAYLLLLDWKNVSHFENKTKINDKILNW